MVEETVGVEETVEVEGWKSSSSVLAKGSKHSKSSYILPGAGVLRSPQNLTFALACGE